MGKKELLKSPCTYQGGKQKIARDIINVILNNEQIDEDTVFYDICCGSGAITIELLNRGVAASQIVMCDISSWGKFWQEIGQGTFDLNKFNNYINSIPTDKNLIQNFMLQLSKMDADIDEEYKYILLQAAAFGGKQIYKTKGEWQNCSFRSYWQPTETSNRRSPVNPMQPMPESIKERVELLVKCCQGLTCYNTDAFNIKDKVQKTNSILYIDPPYNNTTSYGFKFDYEAFIAYMKANTQASIYVSEKEKLNNATKAIQLAKPSKKGGIIGYSKVTKEEWLNKM